MEEFNSEANKDGKRINYKDRYLHFHQNLYGTGVEVEKKAAQLITEEIGEPFFVFFILIRKKKDFIACVRLLGSEELEYEIVFPVVDTILAEPMRSGEPTLLPSKDLWEELRSAVVKVNEAISEQFLCLPYFPHGAAFAPMLCCVMDVCDKCACSVISAPPPLKASLERKQRDICTAVAEFFTFCGYSVALSMLYDEKEMECRQSRRLLVVADNLFHAIDNVSEVLRLVMMEARKLTCAERCSLFLVDKENNMLVAKVFEDEKITDVELPLDHGIVGHVVATGQMMNVENVYDQPIFFKDLDNITGFTTRAVLCVPILFDGEVIAVAELCNKDPRSGSRFTIIDEEIAQSFAAYCGICIKHTLLYEKATVTQARQKLTNELMMYHLQQQVPEREVLTVLECKKDHRAAYKYHEYRYSARDVDDEHTVCVVFEMFKSLNILSTFQVPERTFVRCISYFKRGYRDMPYHNWSHAMAVLHFGYALITNLRLLQDEYMDLLDVFAFLLACTGHDLDHRGTTNTFQSQTQTALASLYSSEGSVMEHHHFNQTVLIVSLDECNILEKLDKDQYTRFFDTVRFLILATDLATHLQRHPEMRRKIQNYRKDRPSHKRALMSLLISCSDLSCVAKEWRTARRLAESVYQEFFLEGELAQRLGHPMGALMNRESAKIPEQQIGFLEHICIPLYRTVEMLFPQVSELVQILELNVAIWEESKRFFDERQKRGEDALDILSSPEFEKEVMRAAEAKRISIMPGPRAQSLFVPPGQKSQQTTGEASAVVKKQEPSASHSAPGPPPSAAGSRRSSRSMPPSQASQTSDPSATQRPNGGEGASSPHGSSSSEDTQTELVRFKHK